MWRHIVYERGQAVCTHAMACMWISGDLFRKWLFPSMIWVLGLNSGHLAWEQALLPGGPSPQPPSHALLVAGILWVFCWFLVKLGGLWDSKLEIWSAVVTLWPLRGHDVSFKFGLFLILMTNSIEILNNKTMVFGIDDYNHAIHVQTSPDFLILFMSRKATWQMNWPWRAHNWIKHHLNWEEECMYWCLGQTHLPNTADMQGPVMRDLIHCWGKDRCWEWEGRMDAG